MRKSISFFLLFLLICCNIKSQDRNGNKQFSFSTFYSKGFIYAHCKSLNYLIKDYVSAFEINITKTPDGSKLWQQQYHFPKPGLAYSYTDLGNPQCLGHANTIYTFLLFPMLERKNFILSFKCSGGIAWISKKFDLRENKYNIAIGSKLNAYLNLNLNMDFRLSPNLYFITGMGLSHFSNGGTQQPNKGLNIFALQTGIRYKVSKEKAIPSIDSIPKFKKKNEFSIIYMGGVKTLEPARTKKYYVSTVSFNAERQISFKTRIGIGLDIFKDNSRKEFLLSENRPNPQGKDLFYAGTHASYDLVFGNTSFTIQMGVYFWQKSKSFENIYHRFGLKYRFNNHWMANLTLKTYWASADFAEWGFGYRF
jgi:hypothetical protein